MKSMESSWHRLFQAMVGVGFIAMLFVAYRVNDRLESIAKRLDSIVEDRSEKMDLATWVRIFRIANPTLRVPEPESSNFATIRNDDGR